VLLTSVWLSRFNIISGYRSAERQAQVNPSVKHSLHTAGAAADTTRDPEVLAWVGQNGPQYGVGYTLAGMKGEENHLEMLGARDHILTKGSGVASTVARAVANQYPPEAPPSSRLGVAFDNPPAASTTGAPVSNADVDAARRAAAMDRVLLRKIAR
jgi:hypothetical protein